MAPPDLMKITVHLTEWMPVFALLKCWEEILPQAKPLHNLRKL